ncbi:MAG: MFS transporter [Actinobacteria bacterium]|nr:MFS transporter [Actinomycetota bacterium]MBI3686947.1 MFS transporter [Actinomycetota bacterium]
MNLAQLHPNLRLRIGVGFVQRLVDSMVTSFMAIYLAGRFGVAAAGGLVVAAMSIAVVGTLLGGHVADVWGRRPTLLLGEAVAAVSFAVMGLAQSSGPGGAALVVFLAFAVNKFAAGFAVPANDAMIIDVSTPESRKLVYTINYWAVNLALAIGALLGGFLYGTHLAGLLFGAAASMALALATTVFALTETKPDGPTLPAETDHGQRPASASKRPRQGYRDVLTDRLFARFVLAVTLAMTIEFQLVNWIGVRLSFDFPTQRLVSVDGWTLRVDGVRMLGLLRAENTILVVLLAFVLHRAFRGVPDRVRMQLGIVLFVAGYMVYAVSDSGWVLLAAGLVLTVGELMDSPVRQAMLAGLIPTHARPRYMAVYALNIRVALVAAALCISLGSVLPAWGMSVLYCLLGVAIVSQYRVLLARTPARAAAAAAAVDA